MPFEKHYSLRAAAKAIGVSRENLKGWLVADLAMEFPKISKGSKFMIRESDLERVIRLRRPQSNWAARRTLIDKLHIARTA